MTKEEFSAELRSELSGVPQEELSERIGFYMEMIDDRMEDGLSEEDAVADVGTVKEIAAQIFADLPMGKIVKEKIKPKRKLRAWEILLLAVGSPIWGSLLIALAAVILSVYVTLWSGIVSLWAVFGSLVGSSTGAVALGILLIVRGTVAWGIGSFGVALVCAGVSIFAFIGCLYATRGVVCLTKGIFLWCKRRLIRKEA